MKKFCLSIAALLCLFCAFGQERHGSDRQELYPDHVDCFPYDSLDKKPAFRGKDEKAFSRWVSSQLEYPQIAMESGIEGEVTLGLVIDTDGRVTDVKVLESVNPFLDREAVRVVSGSPKWSPGEKDGRPVRVFYTFPVIFRLSYLTR